MTKTGATFLAVTAGLVAAYLAVVAIALDKGASSGVDHAVVRGVWIAFGAAAIVTACATFEALSERLTPEPVE